MFIGNCIWLQVTKNQPNELTQIRDFFPLEKTKNRFRSRQFLEYQQIHNYPGLSPRPGNGCCDSSCYIHIPERKWEEKAGERVSTCLLRARKQTFPETTSRLPLISKNYITRLSLASKQLLARHLAVLNKIILVLLIKTKETVNTGEQQAVCVFPVLPLTSFL